MTNNNWDGSTRDRCTAGEVRTLPLTRARWAHLGNSNVILCRSCYDHEMAWRKDRNRDLADDCKFDFPAWESLQVYP